MGATAMRNGLAYVETRLLEWADWSKKGNGFGLGFPSKTPEQILRECGGVWIKAIGGKSFISHPRAEEIERYLCELAQGKRFLALVLRTHYLYVGTVVQKAKRVHVSYSQYRVQLECGKHWLLGRLESNQGCDVG